MHALGRLLICLFICLHSVYAQDDDPDVPKATIPHLPATAKDARGFAPHGWIVQVQAAGDLNADGRADLAFVLHGTDPKLIVHSEGFGVEDLDTNPRIVCVAFAQPDGSYKLVAQNHALIPRWTERNMDDYFGEEGSLSVARSAVSVGLHYFANAGGWDAGSTIFTFRWQHGRFEMIGYENDDLKRNTGEEVNTSINFSTGTKIVKTDYLDDETAPAKSPATRRIRLNPAPLKTLDRMGDGFEYQAP